MKKKVETGLDNLLNSYSGKLNVSYQACYSIGYSKQFGSLDGLAALVDYLCQNAGCGSLWLREIVLDGHRLDTFSLKQFNLIRAAGLESVSLRNNCIGQLTEGQLDSCSLPQKNLDLTGNPITRVSDGAFRAINDNRACSQNSYDFVLSMDGNYFTLSQKQELQKKFYKATHTLPERLMPLPLFLAVKIVVGTAPLLALFADPYYFEEPNLVRAAAMCVVFVWWWYLASNRCDLDLARISHPRIAAYSGAKDFQDRCALVWVENNSSLKMKKI